MEKSPVQKCEKQIEDAYNILRAWWGPETDEVWYFVPLVYCVQMDKEVKEGLENDQMDLIFDRLSNQSISSKFSKIHQLLTEKRGDMELHPSPEEFKKICKILIFCVSKAELPVKGSIIKKIQKLRKDSFNYDHISLFIFSY